MVDVVAALIRRGSQVLICQRPARKARGLKWEFPGGKVEPGETPQNALKRECREELGVEIAVGEQRFEVIHQYPDLAVRLMIFDAELVSGDPVSREHAQILWEDLDKLAAYPFCEADGPILDALAQAGPGA